MMGVIVVVGDETGMTAIPNGFSWDWGNGVLGLCLFLHISVVREEDIVSSPREK